MNFAKSAENKKRPNPCSFCHSFAKLAKFYPLFGDHYYKDTVLPVQAFLKSISATLPLLVLSGIMAACSSTPQPTTSKTDPLSGTDEQIFIGDTLEMTYDPNVIMKRAESYHEKESYSEAIVEYQHFLDLHRAHVLAPYAQYRLAVSHFKMFKTIDRDPAPLQKAVAAFEELLTTFPGNQYEQEARQKILECQRHLAEHHLFVGNFYLRKQSYLAAAHRYELVNQTYPHLEYAADAKYQLALTYDKLGLPEWSRDWLVALVREHPQHKLRESGLTMLAELQKEHPTLVVAENLNAPVNNQLTQIAALPKGPVSLGAIYQGINPSSNGHNGANEHLTTLSNGQAPTTQECSLGMWCGATNDLPSTPIPQHTSLESSSPPAVKTCRAGEWC